MYKTATKYKNFPASVFAVQWINNLAVFDSVGGDRNLGERLTYHDQVITDLGANSLSPPSAEFVYGWDLWIPSHINLLWNIICT